MGGILLLLGLCVSVTRMFPYNIDTDIERSWSWLWRTCDHDTNPYVSFISR